MKHECNFSLKDVHDLSKINNIYNTANKLKENSRILERIIARYTFPNSAGEERVLNFESLSNLNALTPDHPFWETYTKINAGEDRNFAKMTMRELHAICRISDTIDDCANATNIWTSTLQQWFETKKLPNGKNNPAPLSFTLFKIMTEENAVTIFGVDYNDVIAVPRYTINNLTLYHLHKSLKEHGSIQNVAQELDIKIHKLVGFFNRFTSTDNTQLGSLSLRNMSYEDAYAFFDEQYGIDNAGLDQLLKDTKNNLSNKSLQEVHKILYKSLISDAITELGVDSAILKRFLARFSFENSDNLLTLLTIEHCNKMTEARVSELCGEEEYKKINGGKTPLLEYFTLREFHQLTKTARSINELSIQLYKCESTIMTDINKCGIKDSNGKKLFFDFKYLKNLSIVDAEDKFKGVYDETIGSWNIPNDYSAPKVSSHSIFNEDKKRLATVLDYLESTNERDKKVCKTQTDANDNVSNSTDKTSYSHNNSNTNSTINNNTIKLTKDEEWVKSILNLSQN